LPPEVLHTLLEHSGVHVTHVMATSQVLEEIAPELRPVGAQLLEKQVDGAFAGLEARRAACKLPLVARTALRRGSCWKAPRVGELSQGTQSDAHSRTELARAGVHVVAQDKHAFQQHWDRLRVHHCPDGCDTGSELLLSCDDGRLERDDLQNGSNPGAQHLQGPGAFEQAAKKGLCGGRMIPSASLEPLAVRVRNAAEQLGEHLQHCGTDLRNALNIRSAVLKPEALRGRLAPMPDSPGELRRVRGTKAHKARVK